MINLSPRMNAIANQILPGQSVADIGTDHACIPIYLHQSNISSKIILTDSKKGPLQKAKANFQRFGLSDVLTDVRLGNGLSVLAPSEVDAVIIAGMGGSLIAEILAADLNKSMTFSHYVLQPQTTSSELRAWLNHHNFSIVGECLVQEGSRICEVITVKPSTFCSFGEDFVQEMDYEIPRILFESKDPLLKKFIEDKISKTQKILNHLALNESCESKKRELILKNRLRTLEERKATL
ncbi:MAG: SAM-dependent methyltransferase [Clostridia bacterium]|nr:SAM-dependent methyltransferase [Clostridia bacterium]